MKPVHMLKGFFAVSLLLGLSGNVALAAKGARSLTAFGYENCIELKNKTTRVVLAPSGGRVLAYEINGVNTLYLSESDSQGKGGSSVAVAMADRDSGSKPVMGHKLRLGSDRKVVAVGKIPESGVLEIVIGTPIEGDLIGQQLFFEAAIWTEDDMKDLEFAETIPPNSESGAKNGVVIAGDMPKKRGVRIVPDSVLPFSQRSTQSSSLSSGQP